MIIKYCDMIIFCSTGTIFCCTGTIICCTGTVFCCAGTILFCTGTIFCCTGTIFCCTGTVFYCMEVMMGSCGQGGWPGELAGRPRAEAPCSVEGKLTGPGPY